MSSRLAELCLDDDLPEARRVGVEAHWKITRPEPTTIEVEMGSAIDGQRYYLRFAWPDYPDQPPSISCFDPATGETKGSSAWPNCDGFRPGHWDICLPLSLEGFALHPEWTRDVSLRWNSDGNVLLKVLDELQVILNSKSRYRGRAS